MMILILKSRLVLQTTFAAMTPSTQRVLSAAAAIASTTILEIVEHPITVNTLVVIQFMFIKVLTPNHPHLQPHLDRLLHCTAIAKNLFTDNMLDADLELGSVMV